MIRRTLYTILMISLIFITTSCAAKNDASNGSTNGVPFNYHTSFYYNLNDYEIYKVGNPTLISNDLNYSSTILSYYYREIEKEDANFWRINYFETNEYLIDSDDILQQELLDLFYKNVKSLLDEYEILLGINFEHYQDNVEVEKEYIVSSTESYDKLYLIDMYLPVKLVKADHSQTYTIDIPVKTFFAYRNNNTIKLVIDDYECILDYNSFISLSNVHKK